MFEDTDRAIAAIAMMRSNPNVSHVDFMLEFNIDENKAKRLYASIMLSDEL